MNANREVAMRYASLAKVLNKLDPLNLVRNLCHLLALKPERPWHLCILSAHFPIAKGLGLLK